MNNRQQLIDWLHARLQRAIGGISEYQLMRELIPYGFEFNFADSNALFRHHFILFHHLYHLQQQLIKTSQALLINAVRIQLIPQTSPTIPLPGHVDGVRDFYLDGHNLHTDQATLDGWINQFWQEFVCAEELSRAWQALQMQPTTDLDRVRRHFRKLSMQYHPDRGGTTTQFQAIQQAMQTLSSHLRKTAPAH